MTSTGAKPNSLSRRILLLFAIVFAVQILYFGAITMMVQETSQHIEREKNVQDVLATLGNLLRRFHEMTIELGTHDHMKSEPMPRSDTQDQIVNDSLHLQKLLKDDPKYAKTMDEILSNCNDINTTFDRIRTHRSQNAPGFNLPEGQNPVYLGNTDWLTLYMHSAEVLTRLEQIQEDYVNVERDTQALIERQSGMAFFLTLSLGFLVTAGVAFLLYKTFIAGLSSRLSAVADDMVDLAQGKPLKIVKTNSDDEIGQLSTSLRNMERTLADLLSKEKTLLNNAASFISSINREGIFLQVSPACTVLWGIEPDELLGRRISSLVEPEFVDETMNAIERLFNKGEQVSFENRLRRSDGSVIELAWKGQLTEDRNIAVLVAHDVTRRNAVQELIRKSEEEFQGLVNEMPISVVTCDQVYVMSSVNSATESMFRYRKTDLLGKSLGLILTGSPSIAGDAVAQLRAIVAQAQNQPIELNVWCRDRTHLPVELSTRQYTIQDVGTTLATFQDISARFEIERVKRDFVAMISHDVRSPLTALYGTLDMISTFIEGTDEEAEGLVRSAQTKAGTLVQLMNDFLDLEKFEAGMAVLELEKVNLKDLLHEVIGDAAGTRSRFILNPSDNEPVAQVERERLKLALTNLLQLVSQCTIGDGILKVAVLQTSDSVEIRTSGPSCNIPDAVKKAMFSRYVFLPARSADSSSVGGLSLALARSIVEAHRGKVRIETVDGSDALVISIPSG